MIVFLYIHTYLLFLDDFASVWDEPAGRLMVAASVLGTPSVLRAGKEKKTKQGRGEEASRWGRGPGP
jgi:hypothetical protein